MSEYLVEVLEEEMRKAGFNYKSLARAAGLGDTTVRDIIKGRSKSPELSTMMQIADALDRDVRIFIPQYAKERGGVQAGFGERGMLAVADPHMVARATLKTLSLMESRFGGKPAYENVEKIALEACREASRQKQRDVSNRLIEQILDREASAQRRKG